MSPVIPEKLTQVLKVLCEKKVEDLLILDVANVVGYTDFFVIGTGMNGPHVQAMADAAAMVVKVKGKGGAHLEGLQTGTWVLLDAGDFVLHLFQPASRKYYALEDLWGDVPRVNFDEKKFFRTSAK